MACDKSLEESLEALRKCEERIVELEGESNNFEDVLSPIQQEQDGLLRKYKDLGNQIKECNKQERQLNDNIIELNKVLNDTTIRSVMRSPNSPKKVELAVKNSKGHAKRCRTSVRHCKIPRLRKKRSCARSIVSSTITIDAKTKRLSVCVAFRTSSRPTPRV